MNTVYAMYHLTAVMMYFIFVIDTHSLKVNWSCVLEVLIWTEILYNYLNHIKVVLKFMKIHSHLFCNPVFEVLQDW